MSKHTSRIWSLLTLLVVATFVTSFGFSQSSFARQIKDEPIAQDEGPLAPHGSNTAQALRSAAKKDNFTSYREPSEKLAWSAAHAKLGPQASSKDLEVAANQFLHEWRQSNYHGPDPKKLQVLLNNEQKALAANSSPAAMGLAVTGTLRLFTVAVEFDGTDTSANFSHPTSVFGDRSCITETVTFTGPLHNQIPHPAARDNNTFWVDNFSPDYYEKLVFSTEGITERVRPDLTDPEDGKPGINIAGSTMRNYYEEVSGQRVNFDGGPSGVIAWLKVPHSEGYYGANACFDDDAGRIQQMNGLPENPSFPNGVQQLLVDIVDEINQANPNFPWSDYDTDGNGVIDHVVIFHAGIDRSDGGGVQGTQAIWAHRGNVAPEAGGYVADDKGTPDPSDDIKLNGYTMQYENSGTGVLVHEFGHDLGLPDLYDTSGDDESDVVWWDLMSTGSHPGKLFDTLPTHMSAWSKFALGWTDTRVVEPTGEAQELLLGQTSNPPSGTDQAVRVNLPPNEIVYTQPLDGSTQAWWTGNDQNWADVRLSRDLDLTAVTGPISMSFDIDWAIEEDWDYLFLEVSIDGGQTYTQTKGFEVGSNTELTTPDSYPDPNGRLHDYGNLVHGYTGISGDWVRAYHDFSAYAGKNIKVRFRYATDAAFLERGAFIDNIAVTAGATTVLSDPVENNNANGWTATVGTFVQDEPPGAGWRLSNGIDIKPQYYLLEWRNTDGFDRGLLYTYHTIYSKEVTPEDPADEFIVDHVPSNIPGMLVWLRDTRYGSEPFGADNTVLSTSSARVNDSPSEGPKGGLLVVDSHPQPLRAPVEETIDLGSGAVPYPPFSNYGGRVQTTNAAFTLDESRPYTLTIATNAENPATAIFTETLVGPQSAVRGFHDALGYYPGVEALAQPLTTYSDPTTAPFLRIKGYTLSDPDASVVVPAKDYYPPKTPAGFTGFGFETSPPASNVSSFETFFLHESGAFDTVNIGAQAGVNVTGEHSGNPGSTNVQHGYHFQIADQAFNGSTGTVRVWNAMNAGEVDGDISSNVDLTKPITVTASMLNAGSPAILTLYSDFDENQASYVEGSATNGAVPVRASFAQVQQALANGGAGIESLRVAAGEATAVVYTPSAPLDSGATASFTYQLTRKAGYPAVRVVNSIFGPSFTEKQELLSGSVIYLPFTPHQ